jgi:RNA polymerase sigma-B factor
MEDARQQNVQLFGVFRDDHASERARLDARDSLVTLHLPLVEHCARRFRNRGEPFEDLVQVGTIGLIKSIDRFDLGRGVEFSTYATPTIIGEIKRYFCGCRSPPPPPSSPRTWGAPRPRGSSPR